MATHQTLSRTNVFEWCESFSIAWKSSFMAWNFKLQICKFWIIWIISIIYIYIYIYIYINVIDTHFTLKWTASALRKKCLYSDYSGPYSVRVQEMQTKITLNTDNFHAAQIVWSRTTDPEFYYRYIFLENFDIRRNTGTLIRVFRLL